MRRTPDEKKQAALFAKIPSGTYRVYVKTETGKLKYKEPVALADTDEIQVNRDGDPVVMTAHPGRKKLPVLAPVNETVVEILKRKKEVLSEDPVLRVTRADPESPDVLHQVVLALGDEAASIAFEREEAERKGDETSHLSVRRINALKALADTWLKRREQIVSRGVDMETPAFRILFQYIVVTMKEAMDATGVHSSMTEAVFAKFSKMIDSNEWAAEAKNRMKGVT